MEYERDLGLPLYLEVAKKKRRDYYAYARKGVEQTPPKDRVFGIENAIRPSPAVRGPGARLSGS